MQLAYFLDPTVSLFEAGQQFFRDDLDLALNGLTAQAVPPATFLKRYAEKVPALNKVSGAYFLGQLTDQALRENAARRRGEANLTTRVAYTDIQEPVVGRGYAALLVFALELTEPPTRTEVAGLTRAFNRASYHLPVLLLLRYPAAATGLALDKAPQEKRLALSASERSAFAHDWQPGEKVGKITTLFDIDPRPDHLHAGHERILEKLKVPVGIDTLNELSAYWNKVLSVKVLNEDFYRDLSNWYFWAVRRIKTPVYAGAEDDEVRHATALIRLITRLVFTWFLKEKHLVPAQLFDEKYVYDALLKPASSDPYGSTYYKAILQNLFFATLNTEMRDPADPSQPNRRFLSGKKRYNDGYGEAGFLRYENLFTATGQQTALDLFNQVPFLNGGLFECLDPTPEKATKGHPPAKRVLIDCFSTGNQDKISLPDELFFGTERVADLSGDYGDTARKREKVSGLLRILKGYTFTITENTPLEEEIALDPELLGKVFENLLASYNPETQTTARKQTGSFYTPREVVEYMVDESLLAYLRPHLPTGPLPAPALAQTVDQPNQTLFGEVIPQQAALGLARPSGPAPVAPDAEAALRRLLASPDLKNPFDEPATWCIIDALDRLKLLDPACGSGAFPMGALQRLTYLLHRLDPNNRRWKQLQLLRAKADHQAALTFLDAEVKKQAVAAAVAREKEIEAAFDTDNHELDYGRKLYLIENCLYGVDIQPVAVQITKLRCFIALLVEQKATAALAHSPEKNLGIRPLPNLETKFVAANTLLRLDEEAAATARRDQGQQIGLLQMDDDITILRQELREVRHEYFTVRSREAKLALKARDEKLREKMGKALKRTISGSDAEKIAEWNPYDLRQSASFFSPKWMLGVDGGFDVVIGNPPYKTVMLAKDSIYSDYSLFQTGELYAYFFERSIRGLLKPRGVLAFITASLFIKGVKFQSLRKIILEEIERISFHIAGDDVFESVQMPTAVLIGLAQSPQTPWNLSGSDLDELLIKKLDTSGSSLKAISKIMRGLEIGRDVMLSSGPIPIISGSDVEKWAVRSVRYLAKATFQTFAKNDVFFEGPRVLIRETGSALTVVYLEEKLQCNRSLYSIKVTNKVIDPKYVAAILNSSLLQYYYQTKFRADTNIFPKIRIQQAGLLPIKIVDATRQKPVIKLVNQILAAKAADATADIGALERQVDELMYKLYGLTKDEIALVEGR